MESKNKNQTHGYREQMGGCLRLRGSDMGAGDQKAQISSYKMHRSR